MITQAAPAVCRFHLQGNGTKGSKCPYVHEDSGIASAASSRTLARGGQQSAENKGKGKSRGRTASPSSSQAAAQPATAPATDTLMDVSQSDTRKICYRFAEGKCSFGDTCRYEHVQKSLLTEPEKRRMERSVFRERPSDAVKSGQVCGAWKRGKCKFGDRCRTAMQLMRPVIRKDAGRAARRLQKGRPWW